MNSNILISSNNNIEQSNSNISSDIIENSFFKKQEEREQNELKNLRIESSLSLRKKKLNEIIFSKRLKQLNQQNNDDENLYVNYSEITDNIPALLMEEFDIYEDKLSVIHQILSKDYSILHGLQFDERYLMQFIIYKLTELSYNNKDLFEMKMKKKYY